MEELAAAEMAEEAAVPTLHAARLDVEALAVVNLGEHLVEQHRQGSAHSVVVLCQVRGSRFPHRPRRL